MKKSYLFVLSLCCTCVALHGQDGFLGKLKSSFADEGKINRSLPASQQEEQRKLLALAREKKACGLKFRAKADALVNKIKVENRVATPDELYIIACGLSFNSDGSIVSRENMVRTVIPDYYLKSAQAGNAEALFFLLQAYGLGYAYINDIVCFDEQLEQDDSRFEEICVLQLERFPDYKVHSKYKDSQRADERLQKEVDSVCEKITKKKLAEIAKEKARLAKIEKQEQEKARRESEIVAKQSELVAKQKELGETLSDLKIKYPKADVFKSNVKLYKDFASGVSCSWAVAKLENDGIKYQISEDTLRTKISYMDENKSVVLVFESEIINGKKDGILWAAAVVLPKEISHDDAVKKYKISYPTAKSKSESKMQNFTREPIMIDGGMVLIMEYTWFISTETITFENLEVVVSSKVLVGKTFYAKNIFSPKTLLFELLADGSYNAGDNLPPEVGAAGVPLLVNGLRSQISSEEKVTVTIMDKMVMTFYENIENKASADATQKAAAEKAKKDAGTLDF